MGPTSSKPSGQRRREHRDSEELGGLSRKLWCCDPANGDMDAQIVPPRNGSKATTKCSGTEQESPSEDHFWFGSTLGGVAVQPTQGPFPSNHIGRVGESVGGLVGKSTAGRGARSKLKSFAILPRIFSSSRTSGTRTPASVCLWIQARSAQELVRDKLQVGVTAQRLVVDIPLLAYGEITMPGTRSP